MLVACLVDQAAIVIGAGIGRVELDRLVEIVEGGIELAGLAIEVAAADIGDVVVGVELQRHVVVGKCGLGVAHVAMNQRPVGIGLVEAWVQLDRLVEIGNGAAVFAGAAIGRAADIVAFGIARVRGDDARERGDVFLRALFALDLVGHRVRAVGRAACEKKGRTKEQHGGKPRLALVAARRLVDSKTGDVRSHGSKCQRLIPQIDKVSKAIGFRSYSAACRHDAPRSL
ncbi:hypothetical protein D9M68_387230 [compost metagenome]